MEGEWSTKVGHLVRCHIEGLYTSEEHTGDGGCHQIPGHFSLGSSQKTLVPFLAGCFTSKVVCPEDTELLWRDGRSAGSTSPACRVHELHRASWVVYPL